jgi:transposase InsO family protein
LPSELIFKNVREELFENEEQYVTSLRNNIQKIHEIVRKTLKPVCLFTDDLMAQASWGGYSSQSHCDSATKHRTASIKVRLYRSTCPLAEGLKGVKWCEIVPLPSQTAETTAKAAVTEFFARFGCPFSVHTDQGRNFESKLFKAICDLHTIL